jgi:hypothetical protein
MQRENTTIKIFFKNSAPQAFPSALYPFSAFPKRNKKRKVRSFFRQAYFVAFAKLVKVA